MTSRFVEIVVDCHDSRAQAEFWAEVLGYHVTSVEADFIEIAPWEVDPPDLRARLVEAPGPPTLVFGPVPEGKTVKNRLHIDVSPMDRSHDEEVERLLALGATRAEVGQSGDESWTVLADPEGNEFCVLRSLV
jgi:hypothetical protein